MKVSAVIPVFNSILSLERAINSLLVQPEIDEIFLVDDGSNDGSFDLELELERRYSIIKVLTHQDRVNRGASASRNLGLKQCKNEWIQFLDADDELFPGKITDQLSTIDSDSSIVVGPMLWCNSKGQRKIGYDLDIWNGVLTAKLGITSSNLWNREVIMAVGGWDETLINTQEYELLFRICKVFPNIKFSKQYLTNIHETPNSLTRSTVGIEARLLNQYKLRKEILHHIKKTKKFTILYQINFCGYIGTMLRNNNNIIELDYSKFYYFLFKVRKSILDRLIIWS